MHLFFIIISCFNINSDDIQVSFSIVAHCRPTFVISTLLITLSYFIFCASYLISVLFDYSPLGAVSLLLGSIADCKRRKKVDMSKLVNIRLELQRAAPCEQWCYFCSRARRRNLCSNARILNMKPKTPLCSDAKYIFFLSHIHTHCQSVIAVD